MNEQIWVTLQEGKEQLAVVHQTHSAVPTVGDIVHVNGKPYKVMHREWAPHFGGGRKGICEVTLRVQEAVDGWIGEHVTAKRRLRTDEVFGEAAEPVSNVAVYIRDIREEMGLRQGDFGALLGASRQSVISWESGEYLPRLDAWFAMMRLKKQRNKNDGNQET